MNLLLLDQFSEPGGAQQALLELLPAIRDRGWQARVGLPGDGEMFARVATLGFPVERVACGPYHSGTKSPADLLRFAQSTPRLAWQIRRMARRARAALIYVNGPRLLPATALAATGLPVLFHSHSYLFSGLPRKLAAAALRRLPAWVLASCRFVAEPWRDCVPGGRISVVLNGVPGPSMPPNRTPRPFPVIGCIGRIAPEKGQREFLAAAALIHHSLPECRFSIYGAPLFAEPGALRYDAEVRAAAAGLPVDFAGWVPDVYPALANLDLLLVPSAGHEATTRVILEAFAAGVPVIAFPSGGIPEVIENGKDGLLASSVQEMARLSVELLQARPARLDAMAHAARESWCRKFTLERFHSQVLETMAHCVSGSKLRIP